MSDDVDGCSALWTVDGLPTNRLLFIIFLLGGCFALLSESRERRGGEKPREEANSCRLQMPPPMALKRRHREREREESAMQLLPSVVVFVGLFTLCFSFYSAQSVSGCGGVGSARLSFPSYGRGGP